MFEWLTSNGSWLFPGGGNKLVAAFVAVFGWIWKRRRQRRLEGADTKVIVQQQVLLPAPTTELALPALSNSGFALKPLPEEVCAEIKNRPPYQRTTTAEAYLGLKVCWKGKLTTVRRNPFEDDKNLVHVALRSGDDFGVGVHCTINVADFPIIKMAQDGTELWLSGTINDANENWVSLEDVQVAAA